MKIEECRFCNSPLNKFMTFGKMPVANGFLKEEQIEKEYFFELTPSFCDKCSLFQLVEHPDPEIMFHDDYAFLAAGSKVMQNHFALLADEVIDRFNLQKTDLTIEIGNNDGGMVDYLKDKGFNQLGIDPSRNVAEIAQSKGINIINDFFTEDLAKEVEKNFGPAKAFLGANVLAHIPDLNSVFRGVNRLLSDEGVFITEDPYLIDMFDKTSYDQIYDEHVFIFSITSISKLCEAHDLELFDVKPLATNGGSMRYYMGRKGKHEISTITKDLLKREKSYSLFSEKSYKEFKLNCEKSKKDLVSLLEKLTANGKKVAGYGATSKSTTIFNYCNIDPDLVSFISDTSSTKIGRLCPGSHIPIYDHNHFKNNYPDYCFLLAWNHRDEIALKEKNGYKNRWITHTPLIQVHDFL